MATPHPDYARAYARVHPWSHAPVPSLAQREGAAWSLALREANAERAREVARLTCAACDFIDWTDCEATQAARAHADLCCGLDDECAWPGECVTHADSLAIALVVVA